MQKDGNGMKSKTISLIIFIATSTVLWFVPKFLPKLPVIVFSLFGVASVMLITYMLRETKIRLQLFIPATVLIVVLMLLLKANDNVTVYSIFTFLLVILTHLRKDYEYGEKIVGGIENMVMEGDRGILGNINRPYLGYFTKRKLRKKKIGEVEDEWD